jgi:hypothetical protein
MNFNGATIVHHEDLKSAISNYTKLQNEGVEVLHEAYNHMETEWKKIPLYKRFWYHLKAGLFEPKEKWSLERKYFCDRVTRDSLTNKAIHYMPYYIPEQCRSLLNGGKVHYLNPAQCEFVRIFKTN